MLELAVIVIFWVTVANGKASWELEMIGESAIIEMIQTLGDIIKDKIQRMAYDATCYLPEYIWEDISGYSDTRMDYFKEFVHNNAHLIIEFSKKGGILNSSNF